jgi:hypothetical protein
LEKHKIKGRGSEIKMEFKMDQKVVLIFFALGAAIALISDFFTSLYPENGLLVATLFPFVVYVVALSVLLKTVRQMKIKSLIYNSFMSYFLIWAVIWILFYNL